jgi:hypothetical protein
MWKIESKLICQKWIKSYKSKLTLKNNKCK